MSRSRPLAFLALLLVACAGAAAQSPVATVLGEAVMHEADAEGPAARGYIDRIWELVERDYVASRGLRATPDEIAELEAYEREFRRRDRSQRARKLVELEERLALGELTPPERAFAVEFRDILRRLADFDAETDRAPAADDPRSRAARAAWIETWKARRALHDEFGGAVGITKFGHYPFGARARLVARHEADGGIVFTDAATRKRFLDAINAPPSDVVPPGREDFTPYWKLPIPPSYYPDPVPN